MTQTEENVNSNQAPSSKTRDVESPDRADLVAALAGLAPLVAQHAEAQEHERRMAEPLVAALRASGFVRLWLPKELGGMEADPETVINLIEAVARMDGSVGWNFLVAVAHGSFAAYLPEAAARTIWGADPDVILATSFGPGGRATVVDGGYRVTGRWSFASGIHQAEWLCGGCMVYEDDRPRQRPDGKAERFLLLFPIRDVTIVDTWHTGGLRGTGSQDFTVTDAFVPDGYGFDLAHTVGRVEGPLYKHPFLGHGNLHGVAFAAVALGIARHAIDAFTELASGKVPAGPSRSLLRDRPMAQLQVAQADALVMSARAFLLDATRQAWTSAVERGGATDLELARVRLAIVNAGESSLKATEIMHRAGGATSVYNTSALDRCLRDAHTASQHIQMSPEHLLQVGGVLLDWATATS